MRSLRLVAALLLLPFNSAISEDLDPCPGGRVEPTKRYLVVISDLHIGTGRRADGTWHRTEDFRWDGALRTFLDRVTHCSDGRADLVIAGDLLELWQPPSHLRCKNGEGCTIKEMAAITESVLSGHRRTLKTLGEFAKRAQNRIYVVPGNHDAALLLPEIWRLFRNKIASPGDRIRLMQDGLWRSSDGIVLVEHGHQIGGDVNRYDTWPLVLRKSNGHDIIVQPWGENFVQSIFNSEEENYPIIDNLSPETAGARYRMADRGAWRTVKDVARLLAFNIYETSIQQKATLLGDPSQPDPKWDVTIGRKMGHLLFANSLEATDPFRQTLLADNEASAGLRAELDELARDPSRTSDAEVALLCDQIAIKNASRRQGNAPHSQCEAPHLGAGIEKVLVPRRRVMGDHLRGRLDQSGLENVRVFIYGHTHLLEEAWTIDLSSFVRMTVLNSGAFQRVIDEEGFLARVRSRPGLTPEEALRTFQPEDLAPCYTVVLVPYRGANPRPQTVRWLAPEGGPGAFVTAADKRCQ